MNNRTSRYGQPGIANQPSRIARRLSWRIFLYHVQTCLFFFIFEYYEEFMGLIFPLFFQKFAWFRDTLWEGTLYRTPLGTMQTFLIVPRVRASLTIKKHSKQLFGPSMLCGMNFRERWCSGWRDVCVDFLLFFTSKSKTRKIGAQSFNFQYIWEVSKKLFPRSSSLLWTQTN